MTPSQAQERGIKVRALEWRQWWPEKDPDHEYSTNNVGDVYHIAKDGWWFALGKLTPCDSKEAARTAAQADYEARILAALE